MALHLIEESVIEHGSRWTLAVNSNQILLGKTIIVLNRPCARVSEIEDVEWAELHEQIKRVEVAITELFQPDQLNFAFLMNLDAQVHLHVIPRYSTGRTWHGIDFVDDQFGEAFSNGQHQLELAELSVLSEKLRRHLPPSKWQLSF